VKWHRVPDLNGWTTLGRGAEAHFSCCVVTCRAHLRASLIFDAELRRTEPQHPTKLAHRGALVARDRRIRAHFPLGAAQLCAMARSSGGFTC
jgi:hypothetical protein